MKICQQGRTEYRKPRNPKFCSRRCAARSAGAKFPVAGWNKGKHHSVETKAKIGARARGRYVSLETRQRLSNAGKGRHWTQETRHKQSLRVHRPLSPEARAKISRAHLGKPGHLLSESARAMLSAMRTGTRNPMYGRSGPQSPNWQGGISLHPKYRSFTNRRHKIRKSMNGGSHTLQEWLELKMRLNNTCLSCHRKEPEIALTEDHIVPIVHGGSDAIENIQPLSRSCNSRKHTPTINYEQHANNVA